MSSFTGTWVFSYGSNSSIQLRARVENPDLKCVGAIVDGYTRVFCLSSMNWSVSNVPSGAASLAREDGSFTYGCAALLSEKELAMLDGFEGYNSRNPSRGVYRREPMTIQVRTSDEEYECVEGIAYVANDMVWKYPPSEQYLTAIHVMLQENWSFDNIVISIKGILDADSDTVTAFYDWHHPGTHSLTLPAVIVEVNTLRAKPWVMPRTIKEIVNKLDTIGIHSSAQLSVYLTSQEKREDLNKKLADSGQRKFNKDTLQLFKSVLGV